MIDILALSIPHALLVLLALRLLSRDELDNEGGARPRFGFRRKLGGGGVAPEAAAESDPSGRP